MKNSFAERAARTSAIVANKDNRENSASVLAFQTSVTCVSINGGIASSEILVTDQRPVTGSI